MKKIKKMLLCLMLLLSFSMVLPVQAQAAVKINKKTASVNVGKTVQLKISGTKKKAKWSSNKNSVATVTQKGKVTGKKKGTATITAKIGSKKYTCKITVKATPEITLSCKTKTLTAGQSFDLTLKNTKSSVKWSTNNKNVATIKKISKYKYKVTGKKPGTTTITANIGKKKYNCKVTVKAPQTKEVFNEAKAKTMISTQVIEANETVFVLLNSKYKFATDISAKCTFYNALGNPVDYSNDYINYLEKDHKAVLEFDLPSVAYSYYQITYEYTEGMKYFYHKSVIDNLSVTSNLVNQEYGDYVMLTVKNDNDYDCYYAEVIILYYGLNGNIVDIEKEPVTNISAHGEEIKKSYIPYIKTNYEDIEYSRYEVFVSWGYHLGK